MGKLIFQVTDAFAEFERAMIKQRIDAGPCAGSESRHQVGSRRNVSHQTIDRLEH
jgi:hypothetical protein